MKISGLLIDVVAPIGAFLAGWALRDPFGLEGIIGGFLPESLRKPTAFGWLSGFLTAAAYFAFGFIAYRYVPYVGKIVLGLFAGFGVHMIFAASKGPLSALKPSGLPA